jgi:hypothetical protein
MKTKPITAKSTYTSRMTYEGVRTRSGAAADSYRQHATAALKKLEKRSAHQKRQYA